MTDLDLAAIKARADAAQMPWWHAGAPTDRTEANRDSAADVPALLARIAELEAERDEANEDADRMRLVLAIEGGGTDPNGYYAGTPGARLAQDRADAERRGYERAVARLRDAETWAMWCAGRIIAAGRQEFSIAQPTEAADFLDAVKESTDG